MDPRKLFKKKPTEQASKVKDKDISKQVVAEGINFVDKKTGKTPVHDAIDANNLPFLKDIMNYPKTNADISDYDGNKPLHYAAGKTEVDFLIALGIEEYFLSTPMEIQNNRFKLSVNAKNKEGNTPLHYAAATQHARLLVKNGADLNTQNERGETALHLAINNDNEELASFLLSVGANPHLKTKHGNKYENTAFYYAAAHGLTSILNDLVNYNINIANEESIHAIKIAVHHNHAVTAMRIIKLSALPEENFNFKLIDDQKNSTDETDFIKTGDNLLHYAVRTNNVNFVKLISQRCKLLVNEPNHAGITPGHLAIMLKFTNLVPLMHKKCEIKSVVESEDKKTSSNIYAIAAKSGISSLKELISVFSRNNALPSLKETKKSPLIDVNSLKAESLSSFPKLAVLPSGVGIFQFGTFASNPTQNSRTSAPIASTEVTTSLDDLKETSKDCLMEKEKETAEQDTIEIKETKHTAEEKKSRSLSL